MQSEEKKKDFTFVIDDFVDYHSLDNFKCAEARQLYLDWVAQKANLEKLGRELEEKRQLYARASSSGRKSMAEELLQLEQQYEKLETEVADMPKAIRSLEINFTKK